MPIATVETACLLGCRVLPVQVEVDLQPGLPIFTIIGLPDRQVNESRERVRAAFRNSGLKFPLGRLTVNLSPAELPKQGTGLDLAIAVGVWLASQKRKLSHPQAWFVGELSLSGEVKNSVYQLVVLLEAKRLGIPCLSGLSKVMERPGGLELLEVANFGELINLLSQPIHFRLSEAAVLGATEPTEFLIDQIVGQEEAKRVLMIALAGRHNLFLTGPPGVGKSMLAKAAVQLLPELEESELLELNQLRVLARRALQLGTQPPLELVSARSTLAGLLGGGAVLKPGQISLAEHGILFLDELPLYPKELREALRRPLQEQEIQLTRGGLEYRFPAHAVVVAARNPCTCGLLGAEDGSCRCTPNQLVAYERILSEPLLDRFDLFLEMQNPLLGIVQKPDGWKRRQRIQKVRKLTRQKLWFANLSAEAQECMNKAARQFYLSARGVEKCLQVAQTIALLDEKELGLSQIREALQYRRR